MKIQKLKVKGFRSLKDISWSPGNLNIVIGPNGSGKSNLLRALELLSCSAGGKLSKIIRRENGIENMKWDGSAEAVSINLITGPHKFAFKNTKSSPLTGADEKDYSLEYDLSLSTSYLQRDYQTYESLIGRHQSKRKGKTESFHLIKAEEFNGYTLFDELEDIVTGVIPEVADETILSDFRSHLREYQQISSYPRALSNWRFYHYLRTDLKAPIRQPAITQFDPEIATDGSNLISVLHTLYTGNREFEKSVDLAMTSAFGDDFEKLLFQPASSQKIQLSIRWKSLTRPVSSLDISDGTLRFLFLITILANPEPPALIAIDEPETGLHPTMLPIIADFAVDASNRTQVIITTHSADFLDAFHSVTPTTTVMECVDGKSNLKILQKKKLASWLKEYTLGEMFRMRQLEDM